MTVSVLVVDDHPVVRSGMTALLSAQPDLQVLAEADSGEAALDLVASTRPQVVLTDLRMGSGLDGVSLTVALRALPDPPEVIILTTYDHDHDIVRAIEAGAAGYLLKDAAPDTIVAAVLAGTCDMLLLGFCMAAGAFGPASLYVPPAVGVWHDMMTFRPFAHFNHSHAVIIKV